MELKDTVSSINSSFVVTGLILLLLQSLSLQKVNLCTEAVINQEAMMIYEVVPKLFKNFPPHAVKVCV